MPTHWGWSGAPDAFTPRDRVLPVMLILPGVMAGMILLTVVLPWLSPKPFDIDRFRGVYSYLMALIVIMMGYLQIVIVAGAMEVWPA